MDRLIIKELYKVIETLGGKSDILSIVGSYRDTMTDKEILFLLKHWNNIQRDKDGKTVRY